MQTPPAFDSWAVHFENWFTNRKGAVIPDEEEHKSQLKCTIVNEKVDGRHGEADAVENEFELFILVFVAELLRSTENGHVDIAEDDLKRGEKY